uniref:hypothetical protein n=1 Tax=Trichocoleus desertorum TaxID=1481672 RepID=UPI0025B36E4C|nr:hypothetical protein [Trichocoleus desertorum]
MAEALNVAIDPHLIALPAPCNSVNDLEQFVESILAWAEALEREDIKVLIDQGCVDALYEDDFYPYDYKLRSLLNSYTVDGEPIADEDTVSQVVTRLLNQTPYLEEFINISDVLHEESKTSIEPDDFLNRLGFKTSQALQRSLIMLGLWHQHSRTLAEFGGCVFAAGSDTNVKHHLEITVTTEVTFVEPYDCNCLPSYQFPSLVDESFHICFGHVDVLQQVGCSSLWGNANSEQSAMDAIQLRVEELIQEGTTDARAVRTFRLGSKFLESARHWGFTSSGSAMILIDSCARIVIGMPKKNLKPFRISKNSTEQRVRSSDQALAWRNHLTKGGPGFRLMYWETSGGEIEFANVGDKDELIIYE